MFSALRTDRHYPTQNILPCTYFSYSRPQSNSAAGRTVSMKNFNDNIDNRNRDLSASSAVPKSNAPLLAPCRSVWSELRISVQAEKPPTINCRFKLLVWRSKSFLQTITIKSWDNGNGLDQKSGTFSLNGIHLCVVLAGKQFCWCTAGSWLVVEQ